MALEMFWQIAFEKTVPLSSACPSNNWLPSPVFLLSICHCSKSRSLEMKTMMDSISGLGTLPLPLPFSSILHSQPRRLSLALSVPCAAWHCVFLELCGVTMIYWYINLSVALIVIIVIPSPFQDGSQACSLPLLGFVLQGIVGPEGRVGGLPGGEFLGSVFKDLKRSRYPKHTPQTPPGYSGKRFHQQPYH